MTTYRPFLKANLGEIGAVQRMDGVGRAIQPTWELLPSDAAVPERLLARRFSTLPGDVPWRIDARYLTTMRRSSIAFVDRACQAAGIRFIPVLRANPTDDELDGAAAAVAHHHAGLVIRLATPMGAGAAAELSDARAIVRATGLRPSQTDLVFDCWHIADAQSADRTAGALAVPLCLAVEQGWRSVTVLAGAFPETLADVPFGARTLVPRHEARMFTQLPVAVDYGDFGVAHRVPIDPARLRNPNLRWNTGDEWAVYTEQRRVGTEPLSPFLKICRDVRDDGLLRGPESPGQREIAARAEGLVAKPGTATNWSEWATSHHLVTVRRRLDRGAA